MHEPLAKAQPMAPLPLTADELSAQRRSICLKVFLLFAFWCVFVVVYFGAKYTSDSHCSAAFLSWQAALVGAALLSVAPGSALARRSARSQRALEGDIDWSRTLQLGSAVTASFFVGVVAGLLGLGGGELMAPLLLALGMRPQVASATSGFMILFTASSNLVHYLSEGILSPFMDYVLLFLFLGFLSALTGRFTSIFLVGKLHHPSILVFSLGLLLVISMGLLIGRSVDDPLEWTFSDLCD